MFINFEKTKQWFDEYARSFDLSVPLLKMKYDHSLDVMKIGETLVHAMAWTKERARLGVAAALLHDTGRFTQYREFATYSDMASIDHGDRGYDILSAEFPRVLADNEALEVILQAVKWHNKKTLPELGPDAMPFCRLARDADKLDVFALVRRRLDNGTISELLPRHKTERALSPALLDEVELTASGSYKNAHTLSDFLLIQLTWALDINFAASFDILDKSDVLSGIKNEIPSEPRAQSVIRTISLRIEEHRRNLQSVAAIARE